MIVFPKNQYYAMVNLSNKCFQEPFQTVVVVTMFSTSQCLSKGFNASPGFKIIWDIQNIRISRTMGQNI